MRMRYLTLLLQVVLCSIQVAISQETIPPTDGAVTELEIKSLGFEKTNVLPAKCMRFGPIGTPVGGKQTYGIEFAPLVGPNPGSLYGCQPAMGLEIPSGLVPQSIIEVVDASSLITALEKLRTNILAVVIYKTEKHSSEEVKKQFSELNKQILESEMVENITAEVSTNIAAQFEAKLKDQEVQIQELKEQLRRKGIL